MAGLWDRRTHTGGIRWLIGIVAGELADAVARDLLADRLCFDELGWRGLWAYVTAAPPGTAIYHARFDGWTVGDHLGAELLSELRELLWRYTAVHFEGGRDIPFPVRVTHPGITTETPVSWSTVELDDMVSPQVRALLRGE
jgi:hypothetical protein